MPSVDKLLIFVWVNYRGTSGTTVRSSVGRLTSWPRIAMHRIRCSLAMRASESRSRSSFASFKMLGSSVSDTGLISLINSTMESQSSGSNLVKSSTSIWTAKFCNFSIGSVSICTPEKSCKCWCADGVGALRCRNFKFQLSLLTPSMSASMSSFPST